LNKSRIESIGLYLPETVVSTEELVSRMDTKPIFDLEKITGIKNRRFRSDSKGEDTSTLALNAARDCLERSGYDAADMDIIINASISKYNGSHICYFEPTLSHFVKNGLGAHNAINFDIANACAGMNTGAMILNTMIRSGVVRRGMVVSGECITPIADTAIQEISEPLDDQFASLTVGDSGAAFIMDESPDGKEGFDFIDFTTVAHYAELCFGMPSEKNPGIAMYTRSKEMHNKDLVNTWPRLLADHFEKKGMLFNPLDYDYIITHQVTVGAIKTYLKAGKEYFAADMPVTLTSVEEYGNTSTTTHWVVIYNALKEKKIKPGDRILLLSSASGIVIGFLSFTIGNIEV